MATPGCERPRLAPAESSFDPALVAPSTQVWELLEALGEPPPVHRLGSVTAKRIDAGRKLVDEGRAPHPVTGKPGAKLSSYFFCGECHPGGKTTRHPAQFSDPEARLAFAVEKDLPLLAASTFAGIVNRESYFGGDHAERYLPPIEAGAGLAEAIRFCSVELARGREPEPWETEAILAYFWSLEWSLSDLGYTGADLAEMKRRSLNPSEHLALIAEIRERFPAAATATYGEVPANPADGYPVDRSPSPDNGRAIWERACLNCHDAEGASEHYFGDKASTWNSLRERFDSGEPSAYHLIRVGTFPEKAKGSWMPNFPIEKLADAQIEDLRAYVESRAEESRAGKEKDQ